MSFESILMPPPASAAGNKRAWQARRPSLEDQSALRTNKRTKVEAMPVAPTSTLNHSLPQTHQAPENGRGSTNDDFSLHSGGPKFSGIDELSFIASLEAENQANGGWDLSSQYMYSHDIGSNIAVEASWLTDFAMQNTNSKSSHDQFYSWIDPTPCAVSPPCTDPACDDVLPCPVEECDPSACLGEICYDQECLPEHSVDDLCCEQPCPVESKCASFCDDLDCNVPSNVQSQGHSFTTQSNQLQNNYYQGNQFPVAHFQDFLHGCIDPHCLSQDHCHVNHNFIPNDHIHNFDHQPNTFTFPQPYHKETTPSYVSASSRTQHPSDISHYHANAFDNRAMPSHIHSLGPNWSRFLVPGADGDCHLGSATPELSMSIGNTPATLSPLTSQGSQNSLIPRDSLVCRWSHMPHGQGQQAAICNQVFDSAEDLHQHVEKCHIDNLPREDREGNGFYCHWAGCDRFMCRSFQARPKLKRHMQTHTLYKPYTCARCGVQMKTKDAMEKHERTHTGERPYECKVAGCKKIFATSTELKTHMVVHSGEKPHECPICHECFADSSNLSKHKKTHYAPRFVCPEPGCDAKTKRWDQMRRHLQTQNHGPPELLTDRKIQEAYKAQLDLKFEDNGDDDAASVSLGRSSSRGVIS